MTSHWPTDVEDRGDDTLEPFREAIDGCLRTAEQRGVAKCTLERDWVDKLEITTLVAYILFRTM